MFPFICFLLRPPPETGWLWPHRLVMTPSPFTPQRPPLVHEARTGFGGSRGACRSPRFFSFGRRALIWLQVVEDLGNWGFWQLICNNNFTSQKAQVKSLKKKLAQEKIWRNGNKISIIEKTESKIVGQYRPPVVGNCRLRGGESGTASGKKTWEQNLEETTVLAVSDRFPPTLLSFSQCRRNALETPSLRWLRD